MAKLKNKMAELSRDIDYLKSKINGHVGEVGERAHGLPQSGSAGFMPYDMFLKNQQEFITRKYVDVGTDINTLDPGYYYGHNLKNIPDGAEADALALVTVSVYADVKKSLRYTQGMLNKTWVKTIHAPDADNPSRGWYNVPTMMTLWQGSMTSGSGNLLRGKSNFTQLQFIHNNYAGDVESGYGGIAGTVFSLAAVNIPNDDTSVLVSNSEMAITFTSDTDFEVTSNKTTWLSASSGGIDTDKTHVETLHMIVGWNL